VKQILVFVIFCLLGISFFQQLTGTFQMKGLQGAFVETKKPEFSKSEFKSGEFQKAWETYINEKSGFRSLLVRIFNQLDYSIFSLPHAEGVIPCDGNNLMEEDYIFAYYGSNFIGESAIDQKLRRFRFVQDTLAALGKTLMIMLEPGKAGVFPELIPGRYDVYKTNGPNNYDVFSRKTADYGINCLDFMAWFRKLKHTAPYPIFPPYGTHWSQYGSVLAADSLLDYLRNHMGFKLGRMYSIGTDVTEIPRHNDYDGGQAMNLLFPLKPQKLAYPVLRFDTLPPDQRPNAMFVGDSYFWNFALTGFQFFIFQKQDFWYYNTKIYRDQYRDGLGVEFINLKEEIDKHDLFILGVTERFLYNYDWRFIDQLYALYAPELYKDDVYEMENNVRSLQDWMRQIRQKAALARVSIEEAIRRDAYYMMEQQNKENLVFQIGPEYYVRMIHSSDEWKNMVRQKPKEKKNNIRKITEPQSPGMFEQEFPETYKKYVFMEEIIAKIRKSPANMEIIRNNPWFLSEEKMLRQEARARLDGRYFLASVIL